MKFLNAFRRLAKFAVDLISGERFSCSSPNCGDIVDASGHGLALLLVLALAVPVHAATVHVYSDGPARFQSAQFKLIRKSGGSGFDTFRSEVYFTMEAGNSRLLTVPDGGNYELQAWNSSDGVHFAWVTFYQMTAMTGTHGFLVYSWPDMGTTYHYTEDADYPMVSTMAGGVYGAGASGGGGGGSPDGTATNLVLCLTCGAIFGWMILTPLNK